MAHLAAVPFAAMLHVSELHGAATHLAVIAIPVYAVVLMLRRFGPDHQTLRHVEPWLLGAALLGIVTAGATGLLVWGQSKTMLRGDQYDIGGIHFWLGIALALVLVIAFVLRLRSLRQGRPTHNPVLLATGTIALVAVFAQGYLGGRMTYDRGVGVDGHNAGLSQSGAGASRLHAALARGVKPAVAGRVAFSESGLGCASCHGDKALGERGPNLAGGRDLGEFRGVHGRGLFPPSVVTDRDFRAIDAYLRTLPGGQEGGGD